MVVALAFDLILAATSTVPVEVKSSFTLNTALFIAILGVLGGILRQLVRNNPAMKKLNNEREANLLDERKSDMDSMREELKTLKAEVEKQAKEHTEERKVLYRQRDAERAIERHRYNNLSSAFNSLLMLLKKGVPQEEAVEEVEKLRAEQLAREAAEMATYRAGGITLEQEART